MLEEITRINWDKYRYGIGRKGIKQILLDLNSDDEVERTRAHSDLSERIDAALNSSIDLILDVIPVLLAYLNSEDLIDPSNVIDLLSHILHSLNSNPKEPYKANIEKIRNTLCPFFDDVDVNSRYYIVADSITREEINRIHATCTRTKF